MSFWNHQTVTAKKNHQCCWCYQRIEIGEKYVKEVGISCNSDGFQHNKYHLECRADADEVWKQDGDCELGIANERPFIHEGANI